MTGPLVSVVIPTFNRATTIVRAVESVLQQTYRPLEVVVVDDGSTDKTPEVLQAYGSAIVYVRQDNAGPAAARNRGIRESKGDLVAFLDSDDLWRETKLARQVAVLERAGPQVPCCLCNTLMKTLDGGERDSFGIAWLRMAEPEGLWLNPAAILATRFVLFCQAALVRREPLLDCGGFDERLWLMEDHDLALRLALRGPWGFVREPLAVWCGANDDFNLSSAARKQPARVYQNIEYIDRKILAQETISDGRVREYLQRHLRGVRRRVRAERWVADGRALAWIAARGMMGWERLRDAWFRRSRFCPQAQTAPLDGTVGAGREPWRAKV
jgi:glycosyltransferase involved in cell wall biosynthesis